MTTGLATPGTQLPSIGQRGGFESFEFIWPGSDVSVQLDETVLITWNQAIESDEIGALRIYLVDKFEESRVMIDGNITGSELIWTVPLDVDFYVAGRSYWLELDVFPTSRVAVSEKFKLVKNSSQSWSTSTASSVIISDGTTSTQVITRTVVNPEPSSQTAVPTSGDDEFPSISESDHLEASSTDTQTLSVGATVGVATGALLGISLLVLIGVLIYRRKRSCEGHHKTEGGQDSAVVSVPEQHPAMTISEMEVFGPKARIGDNEGVCGHTTACRDFYEME